ncbi:MAG: hypothetical protein WCX61_05460, partial [Candidatus Peribacteraceae bacterium]
MNPLTRTLSFVVFLTLPLTALGTGILEASDTVAGLGTDIHVRGLTAKEQTYVVVLPPYGVEIVVPVTTDGQGNATAHVSGNETQLAGTYDVELLAENETVVGNTTFTVLPEALDMSMSALQSDRSVIMPDGQDEAIVTIITRDRYGNPLSKRPIELISSRAADTVTPMNSETDDEGQQQFRVSTYAPGELALRAMDLLSGKLLSADLTLQANTISGMGGMAPQQGYYGTAMYAPYQNAPAARPLYSGNRVVGSVLGSALYGQVNGFDVVQSFIIEAPAEMQVNQDATMRITAIDL